MCEIVDVILGDTCGTNQGGTRLVAFIAQLADFLVIQKPAANAEGIAMFTVASAHTFKQGKCFKKIEFLPNTGTLAATEGGEFSGTKNNVLVLRVPSNNPNATILHNQANGITPFIVLVQNANMPDGTYDQLGIETMAATIKSQMLPGSNNGEGSLYEFTITAIMPHRLLYTSTVTLTPAA
ncbi:hypothetical protein SAMN04487996_10449 [Dyadobacter soli]|uniref:Uncharacterized protein n=1 Tax=Dyadobacter soli TaxID=659014 RepID=A0A1G7B1C0_9BACT|nr:hypothetical protein [Dyadobacter soli]SDE20924.1 hypothetical protein SAMN04487996_10449 [Dyadobacter soli]